MTETDEWLLLGIFWAGYTVYEYDNSDSLKRTVSVIMTDISSLH